MYGTVARFRAKPGMLEAMVALDEQFAADPPPGFIANYVYQMDDDANEFYMAVVFESREAYEANANSAEQGEFYVRWREMLEADPEWHDGAVVHSAS
jgi:quinol monooxygenase YgiN